MRRSARPLLAVVVLILASLGAGAARGPAQADVIQTEFGPTRLADGFRSMVVDDIHLHVFVSSYWADTVTVLDFSGHVLKTITGLDGAASMLIDGSTLYVVLGERGTVDAYDTTTFARVGRYGAGLLVHPRPLAMAAGKLWTSTGDCEQWGVQLVSIDLASKVVQIHDAPPTLRFCIGLADAPHDTDRLLAYTDGQQPPSTVLLDVSEGEPVPMVERRQEEMGYSQLAVLAGEDTFLAPTGQDQVGEYRMSDQVADGVSYPAGFGPKAVTVTNARGGLLAAGLYGAYDTDIEVYELGQPDRPIFSHDFGGPDDTLFDRGLAWSGDGRWLFAVTGDGNTGATWFHAFLIPLTVSLSVDLTVSTPGQAVTFTAEVDTSAGSTGTVTFADTSGVLATARVADGRASVTLAGLALGVHQVTATYADDNGTDTGRSAAVRQKVTAPIGQPTSPLGTKAGNPTPAIAATDAGGYWLVGADGAVYPFGNARQFGSGTTSAVDIEPTPTNGGYWILSPTGRVSAKGDAVRLGDAPLRPGERAVSLSSTPSGGGYWVFTNRGRAISFGDAPFLGDMTGTALNGPVLGSVATPSGRGYWMVASDGGIFAFGDARFAGSMGGGKLNAPVQSLVPDGDGLGYWLVASDGGIFAFDAPFHGSMGATKINKPIAGMVCYGDGYLMVGADGGIFNFSSLPFSGSLGSKPPSSPVVAVAALL